MPPEFNIGAHTRAVRHARYITTSTCEQKASRDSVAFIVICVATIIEKREKVFSRGREGAAALFSNRDHSDREVIGCVSS